MTYEYSWSPAVPLAQLGKIDPTAFANSLEVIEKSHGRVTTPLLVDAAKKPEHPAHDFIYHVGIKAAARKHYEQRGGLILRSLVITPVETPTRPVRARLAIPPSSDDGGSGRDRFIAAQEVAARSDLRDIHRASLLRRMNLLRQEIIDFDEFAEVVVAIERVLEAEAA